MADPRAVDELGERVAGEELAHLLGDPDPDLLQDAVALAVVVLAHERGERAVDRGEDLGDRDLGRRAREHVAAADAALRADEPAPFTASRICSRYGWGRFVRSAISLTDVGRSDSCSASERSARAA